LTFLLTGFGVSYIAENYENLHHVLVFLSVSGATPGTDIEAEVLPYSSEGEHLIIKSGLNISLPLSLPGRASPGKKEVKVQGGHYEVKMSTASLPTSATQELAPLLDASQLSASSPTSFICASCSLPLVQSSGIQRYRDLPSEHWEELVDAWMCHTDQTLNDHVAKHGRGFWPDVGEALVGGSYILFAESSVVNHNLCPSEIPKVSNPVFSTIAPGRIRRPALDIYQWSRVSLVLIIPVIVRSPRWFRTFTD
jgi:hypothetical protein